ncbi:zinc ribbon domain-containing protein, partial [Clostridium perfringens]|uniref:zinc ribbon domain-containing protein n=1 Tax=Clostridium perfringens TaxID=1502 RepID=UPI001FB1092C
MVRLEIDRRLMLKGKYSGTDILTAKIRCGECGGSYGAKVWHSNDKYRRVMYQCNSKYSGKEKCKTPAIRSEDIESRFVNVWICVNILDTKIRTYLSCIQSLKFYLIRSIIIKS